MHTPAIILMDLKECSLGSFCLTVLDFPNIDKKSFGGIIMQKVDILSGFKILNSAKMSVFKGERFFCVISTSLILFSTMIKFCLYFAANMKDCCKLKFFEYLIELSNSCKHSFHPNYFAHQHQLHSNTRPHTLLTYCSYSYHGSIIHKVTLNGQNTVLNKVIMPSIT